MTEPHEPLTGNCIVDTVLLVLFVLIFGITFVRTAFPRFGPVDYRALGWAVVSAGFYYTVGSLLFQQFEVLAV